MMTFNEFEGFVRNRPKPDTPGVYKLFIYRWNKHHCQEDEKYEAMTRTVNAGDNKEVTGILWRSPYTFLHLEPDYEYHPTFEQAHAAMMGYVGEKDTYGFCIMHLGYGPLGNNECYVSYCSYDAEGKEYDHSSCSSYHYGQPGIYGKFLGRFPEEIPFKEGEIVQILTNLEGGCRDYVTLGVVVNTPRTIKDQWESYCNYIKKGGTEHEYFESPRCYGADDDEYFILFGPNDHFWQNTAFRMAVNVWPPAYPVPDKVRESLMGYYRDFLNHDKDDNEHKECQ